MNKDIIDRVEKIVRDTCAKETNEFTYALDTHFIPVVENAKILAPKLGADEEIILLAAWLHDYASVYDAKLMPEHHWHSSKFAQKILSDLDYPQDKIDQIKHCIEAHRGSQKIPRQTLEAECVASADAMAHITAFPSLLILAWKVHDLNYQKGIDFVLAKMERSWNKLMPEAKELVEEKYQAIKKVFS
ncbi:MAG: HD domain-containing protein [Candidatus Buchananbacteria bacterium]|nr:HD domain-containing protein [Candidatus Buchananbacteria bacterium]